LYDTLGLSSEYGFSRENPLYLTDTSWAGFVAELGFVGAGLIILGLIRVGARLTVIARRVGPDRGPATAALTVLVAAVTMSVGSAALLDSVVLSALGMLTGCALATNRGHFRSSWSSADPAAITPPFAAAASSLQNRFVTVRPS
jgi:hypothetical protein